MQWIISFNLLHWNQPRNHPKNFYDFFCEKNVAFSGQKIWKIDDMTLVINSYSDLSNIFVIFMVLIIKKMFSKSAPTKFKGVTMGRDFGDDRKK